MTTILALNPGSSSLKASVRNPNLLLTCTIQRLGSAAGTITLTVGDDHHEDSFTGGLDGAIELIARQCRERGIVIDAVAHRVVHGGPLHHQPTFVDDELIGDLQRAVPLAPLHLPGDIDTIEHARSVWPHARHVACFDTGFHHDLPEQATRLPVSTELAEQGVRRYGFHGLSIQSALHAHPEIDQAVIAHLGSGCSVTAVAGGKSRHTTMSLTPTGGMVSATRTGDLDPEIVLYLIQQHGHTVDELRQLLDRHAGLAGLAGGRHDVRDLLEAGDDAAALALDVFVGSAAMAIAGCATTLTDWPVLVFTGGVGEHAAGLRERICARLLPLRGKSSGTSSGGSNEPVAALANTGVSVLVVPADEEGVLDRLSRELLGGLMALPQSRTPTT